MNEDFYGSIDRLVEFGMSDKVAKAMMNAMNSAMANMQMPNYTKINQINMASPVAVKPISAKKYFVGIGDEPVGPLDINELRQKAVVGELTPETLVWYQGLPGWAKASHLSEVNVIFGQLPPELPKKASVPVKTE